MSFAQYSIVRGAGRAGSAAIIVALTIAVAPVDCDGAPWKRHVLLDEGTRVQTSTVGDFTKDGIPDIRASDLDADGDLDLIIAGNNSNNLVWCENPAR